MKSDVYLELSELCL